MQRPSPKRPAIVLLLILLSCSSKLLWYAVTPPFEAPDEAMHFDFVRYIAAERRLPDARPESREGWGVYEWIQPPLYYMLLAPAVAAMGVELPDAPGNPNGRFQAGPSARTFYWDGKRGRGTDALFVARLISLGLSLLTVLFVYRAAATALGSAEQAAIVSASLAVIPQFGFLTAAVSNDTLTATLSSATVALLLTVWSTPRLSMTNATLVGLCAGGAVVSKISAAYLFPMIAVAVMFRSAGQRARAVAYLVVSAASATLTAGWYFARNAMVFGDPLATTFKLDLLADVAMPLDRTLTDPHFYTRLPADVFLSFWGAFGWGTILAPPGAFLVFAAITGTFAGVSVAYVTEIAGFGCRTNRSRRAVAGLAAAAGAFACWNAYSLRSMITGGGISLSDAVLTVVAATVSFSAVVLAKRDTHVVQQEREMALTLMSGIVVLVVMFVSYNMSWHASQARLLYPAIAPTAIVVALAIRSAGRRPGAIAAKRWVIPAVLAALGMAWIVCLFTGYRGLHIGA